MVYVYMICVSLSFQLRAYSLGHPCPAVQVPGVAVTYLQGKYYEEDYGRAHGWGSDS